MSWNIRASETHRRHALNIGGVFASREAAVIRTVLGSCIAVCLRDPETRVGGMNHFMLPGGGDENICTRYGVHAMELLINRCMRAGADRRRLQAKVFGGGHVLRIRETDGNVPQSNIRFALGFLETEGIPILSRDLGGYEAREVYFFTDTGRTLLRRLPQNLPAALERAERAQLARLPAQNSEDDSNITLF